MTSLIGKDSIKAEYLLILLLFLAAFLPRLLLLTHLEVSGDEIVYISSGVVYIDNIVHGITCWDDWEINWEHPPLAKYLIGLMVYTLTDNEIKRIPHDEMWIYLYMKPVDVYEDNILFLARLPHALLGSLTSILAYFFGKELFNRRLGAIASLWLSFSYLWFYNTIWVQNLEAPETFFVALAILLFYQGIMKRSHKFVVASGIAFGLALSCKYPAALGVLVAMIWLLVLFLRGEFSLDVRSRSEMELALSLILFIPVIVLTFVLLWGWWILPHGLERTVIHSINRHRSMGHIGDGLGVLGLQAFDLFYLETIIKYFSFAFLHWPFLQWPLARLQSPEPFFTLVGVIVLCLKVTKRRASSLEYLILLYFAVPTFFLSALGFKLTHYILLVWPSLALISALGLCEVLRRTVAFWTRIQRSKGFRTQDVPVKYQRSASKIFKVAQNHDICRELYRLRKQEKAGHQVWASSSYGRIEM